MASDHELRYPQERFVNTRFAPGSFWAKKRATIATTATQYQIDAMKETGRYDAFRLKWMPIYDKEACDWPVAKHCFYDSDVAKFLEGACYFLQQQENASVRAAVDELVDMIVAAQQPDGYLNVHFTVVDPEGRFKNLRDQHELYNAGHLIEAAIAHEQLYGNGKLLNCLLKYVNLLCKVFGSGPSKKPGYPGHPELELALLRLYHHTEDPKHLALGRFFLTERGNPHGIDGKHYYDYEADLRGEGIHEVADAVPKHRSYWYQQAHEPLLQQQTIEGHSVRAVYLLTGLADLVNFRDQDPDSSYSTALHRLWENMVQKKMYLTGGVGSVKQWEGFGIDYFLPQGTDEGGCYAETCASIGVMMLASRLLNISLLTKWGDILELQLYNAVLTGVALDGKSWTYVNQLASSESDPSTRSDWFEVSCCPPNVLRLIGSLGGYFYSSKVSGRGCVLSIHLYADMDIVQDVQGHQIRVSMKTEWPLDGRVVFNVTCPKEVSLSIRYRVPSWAPDGGLVEPKGHATKPSGTHYAELNQSFIASNSSFVLEFPMRVRMISPHPNTGQTVVAVQRGPIVYCVEDVDNDWVTDHFKNTCVSTKPKSISEQRKLDQATGEEYVAVSIEYQEATQFDPRALAESGPGHNAEAALPGPKLCGPHVLNYIPYYFRANRGGKGHMKVGLRNVDGLEH